MTAPATVAEIAAGLSKAQREYLVHGPYPHWTQTRQAMERRGLFGHLYSSEVEERGKITEVGTAVRDYLKEHGA